MPQARKTFVLGPSYDLNLLNMACIEIEKIAKDRFGHSEVRARLLLGGSSSSLEVHLPPGCPDVFVEEIAKKHGLDCRTKNSDQSS